MPQGSLPPSWVQWPFSVSKGTVSGTNGGLRFGSCCGPARLINGGGSLALELGARFKLLEQFWVLPHLAACTKRVAPSRPELQIGTGRHARLSSLQQGFRRNSWPRLLLLWVSSSVLESCRRVDGPHRTQADRAAWRTQHFTSVSKGKACVDSRDLSCS